ncbi:MAG: hypothetical protein IKQ41_01635 [Clostridia bacterium]|nr:hypothetical protein [Clostridia bacterium]
MTNQKEKHPVYWLVMALLLLVLALGVALLIVGIQNGSVFLYPLLDTPQRLNA